MIHHTKSMSYQMKYHTLKNIADEKENIIFELLECKFRSINIKWRRNSKNKKMSETKMKMRQGWKITEMMERIIKWGIKIALLIDNEL